MQCAVKTHEDTTTTSKRHRHVTPDTPGTPAQELKTLLTDRGISLAGLAEKSDLAHKIVEACSKVTYYK